MSENRGAFPKISLSMGSVGVWLVFGAIAYPELVQLTGPASAIVAVIALACLLGLSVLLHELAHAFAAWASGGKVLEIALTMIGGHTQYQLRAVRNWQSLLISLAGPAANGLLALLFLGLSVLVDASENSINPIIALIQVVLHWAVFVNIALGLFNVIPGLPMDGGRALEALLRMVGLRASFATSVTAWLGRLTAAGIVVYAVWPFLTGGERPTMLSLAWTAFLAYTLWTGASIALKQARAYETLRKLSFGVVEHPCSGMSANLSIEEAATLYPPGHIFVTPHMSIGTLDAHTVESARHRGQSHTFPADAALLTLGTAIPVAASLAFEEFLSVMSEDPESIYVRIDDHGHPIGVIFPDALWSKVGVDA